MKNYLIVGGSSGIGQALVQTLADAGHRVYATYFKHQPEEQTPVIHYHYLNVQDNQLDFSYLPESLDGFAYCPGSINLVPFNRIKPEDFTKDFELQVNGAIKVLQIILPKLKAAEKSALLFFSTAAVQTGFSFHSQVSVSKGAIEGLTRALAAELAPHIRVNTIAPSITDTPLASKYLNSEEKKQANAQRHALKKIGSPQDIADMAAFLLSEKASWITGQIIHVDGGISHIK